MKDRAIEKVDKSSTVIVSVTVVQTKSKGGQTSDGSLDKCGLHCGAENP